jgi:rRNA maturation endonuclease Nob1
MFAIIKKNWVLKPNTYEILTPEGFVEIPVFETREELLEFPFVKVDEPSAEGIKEVLEHLDEDNEYQIWDDWRVAHREEPK